MLDMKNTITHHMINATVPFWRQCSMRWSLYWVIIVSNSYDALLFRASSLFSPFPAVYNNDFIGLTKKDNLHGLDYGCGPGPTLSSMFREKGFKMADYDLFFKPVAFIDELQVNSHPPYSLASIFTFII
jgi:hypothetical protein